MHQAILRVHYQVMVWNNDCVANPVLPSPRGYGWKMEDDEWIPVMTTLLPAPEAIIQLVKCKCAKQRCSISANVKRQGYLVRTFAAVPMKTSVKINKAKMIVMIVMS